MRSVLNSALSCVVGALETVPDPAGVTFHRSPAAARRRLGDVAFDYMSSLPSGVRVEALTDTAVIELDLELIRALPLGKPPSTASTIDVVVDGELRDPVTIPEETLVLIDPVTGDLDIRPAGPATVRLDLGTADRERRVEVWLPVTGATKLIDVRVQAGTSLRQAPPSGPRWIHHGSSISQCSEADRPTGTWPAIAARRAGRSLLNLGLGGQCHLDQFIARSIRDLPAAAISLELGINVVNADSMRQRVFVSALHGFLDTIREGHPDTPILVVTPIICPAAEDEPGPTLFDTDGRVRIVARPDELTAGALTLTRIRELLHVAVKQRRVDGDNRLHVVDGLDLFGPRDADDLPDGLHPDADGYARMAERFLPLAFGAGGVLR